MSEPSRAQVDALQSGDDAAWTIVVRWLQPQLDGFFRAGGAVDPEALTQETLLRMSRHIARFVDGGAAELRAWAFAIARTTRIDEARRAAARPSTIPDSARDEGDSRSTGALVDLQPSPEAQAADLDALATMLAHLTPQQSELLRMRILGDVTMAEAASILGIALGAAKQLERRALRRLRTVLESGADPHGSTEAAPRDERDLLRARPTSGTPPP